MKRTIEIEGKTFIVGTADDMPQKTKPARPRPKHYPELTAYDLLSEGERLFLSTGRTLQDDQSWWSRRFDAIARKRNRVAHCEQDRSRRGVWFWSHPDTQNCGRPRCRGAFDSTKVR